MINNAVKKLSRILAATLCVLSCLTLCACKKDYNAVFLNNWEVQLPSDMKEQFRKQEDNWGHYGARFATFVFESEPTDFLEDFEKEPSENVGSHVEKFMSKADFKVPTKYIPDMTQEYYWKYYSRLSFVDQVFDYPVDYYLMLYFPNDMRLSICQYFEAYEIPNI